MKEKVYVRLTKGICTQDQLYIVNANGVQFYSDEHKAWLVSSFTEKEMKKRPDFKEIPFK